MTSQSAPRVRVVKPMTNNRICGVTRESFPDLSEVVPPGPLNESSPDHPLTQPCALNAPGVVEIDVDNYPQEDALRKLL